MGKIVVPNLTDLVFDCWLALRLGDEQMMVYLLVVLTWGTPFFNCLSLLTDN